MHRSQQFRTYFILSSAIALCGLWLYSNVQGQAMSINENLYTGYAIGTSNNPYPPQPACPSGSRTFDFPQQSHYEHAWSGRIDYSLAANSNENLADVYIFKKEDHPERCRYGNGNDPGNSQCDENQYNEGLRIFMNNTNIHDMRDRTGEGISDQYVFAEIRNIPITPGVTNVLSTEKFIQRQDLANAGVGFSTDYITRVCLRGNVAPTTAPSSTPAPSAGSTTGTIRVCQVVAQDVSGTQTITTGSENSGATLSTRFFNPDPATLALGYEPASSVPDGTNFTLPLNLNTRLEGFPNGPGSGGNNAECRTFSNVPLNSTNSTGTRRFGDYYYRATNISGGSNWLETRYNDGHTSSAAANSVSTYSNNLYDGDPTNDADSVRNTNADGNLCLGQCGSSAAPRYDRTIVVYSTYAPPSAAGTGTIRVCQAVGEVDGANTTITTGAAQAGAVLSTRFTDGNPFPPNGEVAPSVPDGTDFTLPLNLNTRIAGFPDGSGFGSYNAECRVYTNLILDAHYYRQTTITGGSNWLDPLYHDSWTQTPSISNMSIFYNNLFDGDPSNDDQSMRNGNADGNMCLGSCSNGIFFTERLLMLYARYNRLAAATPAPQFFQIFRGNVYSDSNDNPSIDSPVGTGQSFVINPPGIVLARNAIDFSGGQATPLNQKDESYPTISDSNRVNYQAMWDKYKNDVQILNISGKSVVQDSGVYLHNGLLGDNDLLFNSSAWDSWNVQNKVTIFVDGDLYINRDINVADNGQALLTLVVSGSVGIGPDVTNVDAVLIANQTLDTACDPNLSPGKFDGSGKCRPHDNQITTVPQLELNGMFILNGGAYLDRKNASSGDPAELFSLRPDFYLSAAQRLGLARYNWIELRE